MTVEWPFGQSFKRARVRFLVDEGATLLIVRNGSGPLSFGAGFRELCLTDVAEFERLELFAKDGNVELLGFDRQSPFVFVVR